MCRSGREAIARHLLALLIATAILCGAAPRARAQTPEPTVQPPTVYLLDVRVNGWPLDLVARFREEGDRLSVRAAEFDGLGFRVEEAFVTPVDGERWVYLDQVPGLAWRLDRQAQTLDITAPFERLKPTDLAIAPRTRRVQARADWGVLASYDLYGSWSAEPDDPYFPRIVSANLEGRLFSPGFTAVTTGVATVAEANQAKFIRLESTVTIDNPDAPWRLLIGDGFRTGPSWARPFRFGGVQWSRNFGLRPDMVTTPMPVLGQNVAVPSTVDIFVNEVKRYSQQVTPGALRLTDLPISSGSNSLRVVVTDPSGRRQELVLPLYSSSEMLAKGLSTFDVEAGFAREDYALESSNYGDAFVTGSYGYGVTDALTLNGNLAGASGYWSGGFGGVVTLGSAALLEAAVMHSDGAQGSGWAYLLSFERVSQVLSLSARYVAADERFRDLAARFGADQLREQALASVGLNGGRYGQLNATFARQRRSGEEPSDVVSGSYGVDVLGARLHLGVSGYADLGGAGWGALVSASFPLGGAADAYVQLGQRSGGTDGLVQVRGEALNQRLDWEVEATESKKLNSAAAQVDWDGYKVDLHVRAGRYDDSTGIEGGVVQTFVLMDGGVFVAGRINDAFTVVETPGSPNVRVMLENHYMGRTDRHGRLLIPDLEAYAANSVTIDPRDLDMGSSLASPVMLVAPRDRAGVLARFPIQKTGGVLLTLRLPEGAPPPVGADVTGAEPAIVGYGGETYIVGLRPGLNQLEVAWPNGRCTASFTVPADLGGLLRLGPYTCAP